MCISTRLLLQAILGVNLSKIFRGLRPRTPAALAQALFDHANLLIYFHIFYENGFLLISQIGCKNVCISTRLLLQAILGVNLTKIFRGLRPRTPVALARAASRHDVVMAAVTGSLRSPVAERSVRYAHLAR